MDKCHTMLVGFGIVSLRKNWLENVGKSFHVKKILFSQSFPASARHSLRTLR